MLSEEARENHKRKIIKEIKRWHKREQKKTVRQDKIK